MYDLFPVEYTLIDLEEEKDVQICRWVDPVIVVLYPFAIDNTIQVLYGPDGVQNNNDRIHLAIYLYQK